MGNCVSKQYIINSVIEDKVTVRLNVRLTSKEKVKRTRIQNTKGTARMFIKP